MEYNVIRQLAECSLKNKLSLIFKIQQHLCLVYGKVLWTWLNVMCESGMNLRFES